MGVSDSILKRNMGRCSKCQTNYVCSQFLVEDDSGGHGVTVDYPCPCQYSIEEKRAIVSLEGDFFLESYMPKKNMEIIRRQVLKADGRIKKIDINERRLITNVDKLGEINAQLLRTPLSFIS